MFMGILGRSLSRTAFSTVAKRTVLKQSVNRLALTTSYAQPARTFFATHFKANQQRQSVTDILRSELKIESDLTTGDQTAIFKPYLDKYGFSIVETSGKNEAEIVRQTDSGETVRVYFDVAQVVNLPFDNAIPEENMAEEGNGEEFDSLEDNFANVNVIISNNADGSAVSFDLLMNLQDHSFYVDSITPFKSIDQVLNDSADAQYKKDLQYQGPPFSNLDEGLQESLELYLESRGINEELSGFITAYSEFKENSEYISWLENMTGFFESK